MERISISDCMFPLFWELTRVEVDLVQLRSALDRIIIYQPYQSPIDGSKETALRFVKLPNHHIPKSLPENDEHDDDVSVQRQRPLRIVSGLNGGYDTVFMPGPSASFIIRSASCLPQIIRLDGTPIQSLSPLHTLKCLSGFVYIDREVSIFFYLATPATKS